MTRFESAPLLEATYSRQSVALAAGEAEALGGTVLRFATFEGGPEIFDTVQGEGPSIGKPATFARLSGCNLACSWCDTPNTWVWNQGLADRHNDRKVYDREAETVAVPIDEAADRIVAFPGRRAIITGGEPLLQRRALAPFIDELRRRRSDQIVEIETNGTIPPGERLSELVSQFNVSPKLGNSGNTPEKRRRTLALKAFTDISQAFFKFVVAEPNDLPEVHEIVEQFKIAPERVYLMPEGRSPDEVNAGARALVDVCKERGYNLTTRLHIQLWGDKRGV